MKKKRIFWLYLIVGIVYSTVSVIAPTFSGNLLNTVIYKEGEFESNLILLAIVYGVLLILAVLDQHCANLFLVKQKKEMRDFSCEAILKQNNLNREKISSFVSFINNDIPSMAENYFQGMIDILKCLCIVVCSSFALLQIHWVLALVIVGSSMLIVVTPNMIRKRAATYRSMYADSLESFNTMLESFLEGMDVIRAYSYQKKAQEQIQKSNQNVEKQERKVKRCQLGVYGSAGGLQIAKKVLILTIGVYLIYIQSIKVGELLVAVQLAEMLAAPIEVMAYLINGRNETKPLVERYEKLLTSVEEKGQVSIEKIESISAEKLFYSANNLNILTDFSYVFEAGKKYMLVGKSGSGKSTLLKLLGKVENESYTGKLYVNGVEYQSVDVDAFYKRVGIVPQEPYLFWTTLEENILLGRAISRDDYLAVIEKLNLTYLLERFEKQSLSEEVVNKLSGGEKQRIALARAMVGKPDVYLLDEISSSLDERNAWEIENMLLNENAMIIYVCHKIIPDLKERYDEIIALS